MATRKYCHLHGFESRGSYSRQPSCIFRIKFLFLFNFFFQTKYFPTIYMENLYWLERTKLTTPVVNFQEIPSEVRKNFNDITYNKGAAVLRMLEVVLKEKMHEVFVQFVANFAFKTVTTSDFIDTVMRVTSDAGVREFMESYLYQNQFPVIFVDEDGDNWVLRQESYGFNPSLNRADFSARY